MNQAVTKFEDKPITFTPLGETSEISLTPAMIRAHVAVKTRKGATPSNTDLITFLMLCKAGSLNPWTKDAYLVGYDSKDGPVFTLIVAHQALLKRAENSPHYRGMESGVVVTDKDGNTIEREGDLKLAGDRLIGGWAKVYRDDRVVATSDRLELSVYSTGRSRWKVDPAGMIVKCAEGSALRKAFPLELGSMYTRAEMAHVVEHDYSKDVVDSNKRVRMSSLNTPKVEETKLIEPGDDLTEQLEPNPATDKQGEVTEITEDLAREKLSSATTDAELNEMADLLIENGANEDMINHLVGEYAEEFSAIE